MKTLLITFIASLFLANTNRFTTPQSEINKNNHTCTFKMPSDVGRQTKDQFYKDFGNVTATKWESTKRFDEATFIKDGKTFTAYYDAQSVLIGTTTTKTFTDLPAIAQIKIKKDYKDYTVGNIFLFDDNELNETDMILYNQPFEDADNYFVELVKDNTKLVVQCDLEGNISYFKKLK